MKQTKSKSTGDSEPNTTIAKPLATGQVKVTVLKAKDIENKEMFGKSDPYNQKGKSAAVKINHNPE